MNNKQKMKKIGILPCSGACNVGVLTSDTVKYLVEKNRESNLSALWDFRWEFRGLLKWQDNLIIMLP